MMLGGREGRREVREGRREVREEKSKFMSYIPLQY